MNQSNNSTKINVTNSTDSDKPTPIQINDEDAEQTVVMDRFRPAEATTNQIDNISDEKESQIEENIKQTQAAIDKSSDQRRRSASRNSSLNNDDPKSLGDSISAASGKQNWSLGRDLGDGDEPSISSIKGDSISATIADYNRKHQLQRRKSKQSNGNSNDDQQSRSSVARNTLDGDLQRATDDLSSNVNFYIAGSSSSTSAGQIGGSRPSDFMSISSIPNADAFDIIEESSNVSSCEDSNYLNSSTNQLRKHHKNARKHHSSSKTNKVGCGNSRTTNHGPRNHQHRRGSSSSYLIDEVLEIDDLPQEAEFQIEPIVLRGNGNMTLFGLSNSFSSEFPSSLLGRVSREEFEKTMHKINSLLKDQQSLSAKLLLFGGLCCCCSLGFSLVWPSIALKKRSKTNLKKLLSSENQRLYSKLGLNWRLGEQRCYSNHAFVENVLLIEFTPKINLYLPD